MAELDPDFLLDVLQRDRCALCFTTHQYGQNYLNQLLEEGVTDPQARGRLLKSRGFCRKHAWQAVGQAKALGMAVVYGHLLKEGLKRLDSLSPFTRKAAPCEVCAAEQSDLDTHTKKLAALWASSSRFREAFGTRGMLCLPHLEKTLGALRKNSDRAQLLKSLEKALEPLIKDLNEFLEKQDYHRSKEAWGPEWDAWIRAVRAVAGERD